jgi:hypothetical protein
MPLATDLNAQPYRPWYTLYGVRRCVKKVWCQEAFPIKPFPKGFLRNVLKGEAAFLSLLERRESDKFTSYFHTPEDLAYVASVLRL